MTMVDLIGSGDRGHRGAFGFSGGFSLSMEVVVVVEVTAMVVTALVSLVVVEDVSEL